MTTKCETLLSDSSKSPVKICYKKAVKRCCVIAYINKDDDVVCYHLSPKETEKYGMIPTSPKNSDYHKAFILDDIKCFLVFRALPKNMLELLWYKADTEDFMRGLDMEYYHSLKKKDDSHSYKCSQYDPVGATIPKDEECCHTCSLWEVCQENGYPMYY